MSQNSRTSNCPRSFCSEEEATNLARGLLKTRLAGFDNSSCAIVFRRLQVMAESADLIKAVLVAPSEGAIMAAP